MRYQPSFLMKVILKIYQSIMILLTPILILVLLIRVNNQKEDFKRLSERFGRSKLTRPSGPLIWVHAASVGESISALPLIEVLLKKNSDLHILITTNTRTSANLMKKRLPARAFHQFVPFDQVFFVNRFLKHWNPQGVLWLESELWPTFLSTIHTKNIPSILINARLSNHSFEKWQQYGFIIRFLLNQFSLCLAQSTQMAIRLRTLGAPSVRMPGNLKFANVPLPVCLQDLAHLKNNLGDRPVWCAASTHEGEEILIAEIHGKLKKFFPNLLTILVPRHPDRGAKIYEDLRDLKLSVQRRSIQKEFSKNTEIYLCDTLGELGLFYRLSPIVFLGGSFVPIGGHNPIEPALLECALVWGPHMENCEDLALKFLSAEAALQPLDQETLFKDILKLLQTSEIALDMAEKARRLAESEQNVLIRILEDIKPYFPFLTNAYLFTHDCRHKNV